jgi:hypothetical protein
MLPVMVLKSTCTPRLGILGPQAVPLVNADTPSKVPARTTASPAAGEQGPEARVPVSRQTQRGVPEMSTIPVRKQRPRSEKQVDETIDDSFPASDPPSYSRTARSGAPPHRETIKHVDDDEENVDANGNADDAKDQADRKDETS